MNVTCKYLIFNMSVIMYICEIVVIFDIPCKIKRALLLLIYA